MVEVHGAVVSSEQIREGDGTLVAVAGTLHEEATLVVTDHLTGTVWEIPARVAEALSRSNQALRQFDAHQSESRLNYLDLTSLGLIRSGTKTHDTRYALPIEGRDIESLLTEDGMPYLTWLQPQRASRFAPADNRQGWRLTLVGAEKVTIGFAAWDDEDAVRNLIDTMQDPHGMLTIAGMMDPAAAALLSARLSAATLKDSGDYPTMTTQRVRKILHDANLGTPDDFTPDSFRGRVRVLPVVVSGRKVSVAVGILPPMRGDARTELTDSEMREWRSGDRDARLALQAIATQRGNAAAAAWRQGALTALANTDWRVVTGLATKPRDQYRTNNSTDLDLIWVTRLTSDQWSAVAHAATQEAKHFLSDRAPTF